MELESARSKTCKNPIARENLKAIISIRNCILQGEIDEFTTVVDKATDDILAAIEIDVDKDFTSDVCQ